MGISSFGAKTEFSSRDGIVKMGYGAQPHGTEGAEHIATLSSDSHQSID